MDIESGISNLRAINIKEFNTDKRKRAAACIVVGMIAFASSRGQNNSASAFIGPEHGVSGNRIENVENIHGSSGWSDFGYADFGDPVQRNEAILDIIDEVREEGAVRLFVESDEAAAIADCDVKDMSCIDEAAGVANSKLAEELQGGENPNTSVVVWDYSKVQNPENGINRLDIIIQDVEGVFRLASSSATSIERDRIAKPLEYSLDYMARILQIPSAQNLGATGDGTIVVVAGTPMNISHHLLRGHLSKHGICISTRHETLGSYCPNNVERVIGGPEVAADLSGPFNPGAHETGTASIVAVASPGALILPIQVASPTDGGLGIYFGDVAKGMQELLNLQSSGVLEDSLASFNMSFGGGLWGPGNCNEFFPVETQLMQKLVDNGITITTALGNKGEINRVAALGCVQLGEVHEDGQIGVGSITPTNSFSKFTNWSPLGSLLAPGEGYWVAYPGNKLRDMRGTSGSAPWIAGFAADLRSRFPEITPSDIESALLSTGTTISDSRGNRSAGAGIKPDIVRAIFELLDRRGELQRIYIPINSNN